MDDRFQSLRSANLDASNGVNPYCLASRRGAVRTNGRFFTELTAVGADAPGHFLAACFLCKKALTGNRDIFMYRGDLPFCSEECRQTQIEADEMKENTNSVSLRASSRKELQRADQEKQHSCSSKGQKARAGSILAG